MGFSYKRLFHLMIDRDIRKEALREAIGASPATMAKLSRHEYVAMSVLDRLCTFLACRVEDIVEHVPDGAPQADSDTSRILEPVLSAKETDTKA